MPVPLPPVHPLEPERALTEADIEERDSFVDERAVGSAPYHPRGWKGRLPGPAADGAVGMGYGMGMGMGGGEGPGGGRVLVF